jgi:hypothetical protein
MWTDDRPSINGGLSTMVGPGGPAERPTKGRLLRDAIRALRPSGQRNGGHSGVPYHR